LGNYPAQLHLVFTGDRFGKGGNDIFDGPAFDCGRLSAPHPLVAF
jgi:hypothetical protein